jgi:membrane protease YdiL (CAAX protease family)
MSACVAVRSAAGHTGIVPAPAERTSSPRLSITLGVVLAAALPGVVLVGAVRPTADAAHAQPALVDYAAHTLAWHAIVLLVIALVLPRVERQSLRTLVGVWWSKRRPPSEHPAALLWFAIIVSGALAFSPLRLALIDVGWRALPGPAWSVNSPSGNRGAIPFAVGPGLLMLQLVVRIPLTVFVEETLFRGWVLERHGLVASAVLFAAYHLSQWWTIGALIPFGLVLALLRAATRSLWPGAIGHWVGNAMYAFSLR